MKTFPGFGIGHCLPAEEIVSSGSSGYGWYVGATRQGSETGIAGTDATNVLPVIVSLCRRGIHFPQKCAQ